MSAPDDFALAALLDLDGHRFTIESGDYTVKFDIVLVEPTENIPHGIKYSLSLLDKNGDRILGYDNSNHDFRSPGKRGYVARKTEWDHRHHRETVKRYEFSTASKLVEDFWEDVRRIIKRWR
ncbi:MAG: hypothetical protein GX310_10695 [Synergistaceae bacterium]|nr:hypothetical protein [Synergistaceae bacterium]